MYCNRSWSKAVYFRADQVRRMSETELALIRAERSAKDAAKRAKAVSYTHLTLPTSFTV